MNSSFRRLLASFALVAVAAIPTRAEATTEDYCSFPPQLTAFTLNQDAFEANGTEYRLTINLASESGSAFITAPIPLAATTSAHAHLRFQMGPNTAGGDGVALVLQNSAAGASAIGSAAGGMGYAGITPSVIVEFDTFKNTGGDPNANHVGLMLNGSATVHTTSATPAFTMAGAGVLNAWVDYDGVGHAVSVFLAQTATKPAAPLFTKALNLFTQLGAEMFVGVSSATGTSPQTNQHDVFELEVSTSGVPCSCEGDSACSGATPACATSGVCATCSASNGTACTGGTPVCDVPTNSCVGCLTNATCAGSKPICDSGSLTCRACAGGADCGGATPYCATVGTSSGDCVVCIADVNCPPGSPRCTPANTCAQCITGADCGGDTPVCKAGACTGCASDADCGGSSAACEVWGACGQCSMTNGAACTGGTHVCDFPTGTCVGCEFNGDCSAATPTCNPGTHTCQHCQTNADCGGNPGGSACVTTGMKAGACVTCTVDSDCTGTAAPKCDTVANRCVACLANSDCTGSTPVCNASNLCVGCLTATDCPAATPVCNAASSQCTTCSNDYAATNPGPLPCPTSTLPACQPAGTPLAGQCAACSSVNDSVCVTAPTTPICVTASAMCGCGKDTDCSPNSYCETSTTSTGVCALGCREVKGDSGVAVDNCVTGEFCSKTDGSLGTCMTQPCNSNADCKAPDAVCNTIVQPHVCAACLNDTDCPGAEVCDPSNLCVACTSTHKQACKATGAGSSCLASETCGCATDTDCGDGTSGRVCNAAQHACEVGCRGKAGNGCPAGEVCSSKDSTLGHCEAGKDSGPDSGLAASADAGAADAAKNPTVASGCSCRAARGADGERARMLGAVVFGLALARRRRKSSTPDRRNPPPSV